MKTMIAVILDRSGSMAGREGDVIQGVNHFIDEQKKLDDPASISLARFDTEAIERFHAMTDLRGVGHITLLDYQPRGGTPLLDAVGQELEQLEHDWRRERPERAIVVIVTDGMENSSRRFDKTTLKRMIQARQESGKWAFIYLGANVDAFAEAHSLGIYASNSAGWRATAAGTASAYNTVSDSVRTMRATGQNMASNLGGNIAEDGKLDPFAAPAEAATWQEPKTTPGAQTWKEPT